MTPSDEPRRRPRRQAVRETQGVEIPFGRKNYIIFAAAAVVILVGYVALSRGSITLAPILLLTGYLVLIPWGILAK
jgi:NADPH-dependent 2,4-dienoyl-CoA reductase/sulfur reductase-like enzyme